MSLGKIRCRCCKLSGWLWNQQHDGFKHHLFVVLGSLAKLNINLSFLHHQISAKMHKVGMEKAWIHLKLVIDETTNRHIDIHANLHSLLG